MSRNINRFVSSCTECNRKKKGVKHRCPMIQFHAGAPMERVHLDFLGPLPKTDKGN